MNQGADFLARVGQLAHPWILLSVATLGATAVVAGAFEPKRLGVLAVLVATTVFGSLIWDVRQRLAEERIQRPLVAYEGPLLWVVAVWICIQLAGGYEPSQGFGRELFVVAAALLAWMTVTFPPSVSRVALALAALLEIGLAVRGAQSLSLLLFHMFLVGVACVALSRFAHGEHFRTRMRELRDRLDEEAAEEARARDFGLLTVQARKIDELPSLADTADSCSLSFLEQSLELQLEVIQRGFNLTTAALLWRTEEGLTLKAISSRREGYLSGPFPLGRGVPGSVCRDGEVVKLERVHDKFGGLPYYGAAGGVGSALAMPIRSLDDDAGQILGVLCFDRETAGQWTEDELAAASRVAEKIALDHRTGRALKAATTQRAILSRFSAAFLRLNHAQGVQEVGTAVEAAVRALSSEPDPSRRARPNRQEASQPELMVITLRDENRHAVVFPHGRGAEQFRGRTIDPDTLVAKALEHDQTLPVKGAYRGHGTVFFGSEDMAWAKSLLVIPLSFDMELRGDTDIVGRRRDTLHGHEGAHVKTKMGCMVVAASKADAFSEATQQLLQLIADQVAIKLELAHSHEKIQEMAKTDPLTGLANNRTFQLAFANMLKRSRRRKSRGDAPDPVALILPDIDHFKSLNDTYGHPFGDEVLKDVGRVLGNTVRSGDLVAARIGGEEFALLLEDCDQEMAMATAERVREEIEALTFLHPEKGAVSITMSMGVATYPEAGDTPDEIRERADQALYLAKNNGRNQVRAWTEVPGSAVHSSTEVGARL